MSWEIIGMNEMKGPNIKSLHPFFLNKSTVINSTHLNKRKGKKKHTSSANQYKICQSHLFLIHEVDAIHTQKNPLLYSCLNYLQFETQEKNSVNGGAVTFSISFDFHKVVWKPGGYSFIK